LKPRPVEAPCKLQPSASDRVASFLNVAGVEEVRQVVYLAVPVLLWLRFCPAYLESAVAHLLVLRVDAKQA
jgi:hypothetical protein